MIVLLVRILQFGRANKTRLSCRICHNHHSFFHFLCTRPNMLGPILKTETTMHDSMTGPWILPHPFTATCRAVTDITVKHSTSSSGLPSR